MRGIYELLKLTFKETVRDRFFYIMIFFALFFIFSTLILNEMVIGEPAKVTKDLTLSSMEILTFFFLLIYGSTIISREIESKSLYTILSRPISKEEFILSNFLDLILSSLLIQLFVLIVGGVFIKVFYGEIWLIPPLEHLYFLFFETVLLSSFAILLSISFSSNFSMLLFLFIYISSKTLSSALQSIKQGSFKEFSMFFEFLKYIVPNFSFFDYKTELLYNVEIKHSLYALVPLYSFLYTIFIVFLSIIIIKRKEL